MSKLFVDQVDPKTATTLTLGTSGDTISIPSGVTIANAGTATGFDVCGTNLFRATMSGSQTSVADNTWTKALFDTDVFDADGVFDTSNNRFIAPAAGKYFFIGKLYIFPNTANGPKYWSRFYKNGSGATKEVIEHSLGSSDNYLARFDAGSGVVTFDSSESIFQGYRVA